MISKDEVHTLTESVEGWLTKNEGGLLYDLAKEVKGEGVVVEIGSWQGKSTIYLGSAIKAYSKKNKLYAVDPHVGSEEHQLASGKVWTYDAFIKNITKAGLEKVVTPVVKKSTVFAAEINEGVELIFIDGAHDYKSVEEDLLLWLPKVNEGGVLAFHDTYCLSDSYKVLRKHVYTSRLFGVVRRVDSITYVRKKHNTLIEYAVNLSKMCYEDVKVFLYKFPLTQKVVQLIKSR